MTSASPDRLPDESRAGSLARPVLAVENLSVALPRGAERAFAVEDVSFAIKPREIVCIVGESGSGKSVTSLAVMGLLAPGIAIAQGALRFEEHDIRALSPRAHEDLRGDRMAMIFQEPMSALNPAYTAGEQIEEIFRRHRPTLSGSERRARTMALLDEVRLPEPARIHRAFPHELSGGQRQRIMIAMALALDPKLLIADEPTTALDVTTQAQILRLIKDLNARHDAAILFITHDFGVVAEIADRAIVMRQGRIVEQGTAEKVLNRPDHPYTKALINAVPRRRLRQDPLPTEREDAVRVTGLAKSFRARAGLFQARRRVAALDDVDLSLGRGEALAIVGESGSGKTTLARCLMRLIDPDRGEITLGGTDVARLPRQALRAYRKDIQIVFQDPYASLNPRRSVGAQLIQGPLNFGVPRAEAEARVRRLLDIVRLPPESLERYPNAFSGGQRQRLCIVRALAVEPQVLIADEAVSALDVSIQKQVLDLINTIRATYGLTVLFITHDLRVASQVADRVIVMQHGKIVESGPVTAIFGAPGEAYTKALLAAQPGAGWEIPSFEGAEAAAGLAS
ncbi:MAG: ABC transporter ATP-binding protein [Pseudomonadota bacterium]